MPLVKGDRALRALRTAIGVTRTADAPVDDDRGPAVGLAIAAWTALGMAVALGNGTYSTASLILVIVGWIALVIFAFAPAARRPLDDRIWLVVAGGVAVLVSLRYPAGIYGTGAWLGASRVLSFLAASLLVLGSLATVGRARQRWLLGLMTAMTVAAGVAMVRASPRPRIDVWYMYQAASRQLLHGGNLYHAHWAGGVPGEVASGFSYLPGSAVLLAPFNWIFGDVRYGLIAATATAGWLVFSVATGPRAWVLASLILTFPKGTFGIEQSWNDPLLLALTAAFVALVTSHRTRSAVVALVAILLCKQYAWLLVPLAATWRSFGWKRTAVAVGSAVAITLPWALTARQPFWHSVISYPLRLPARGDSLSLFSLALRHGLHPPETILGAATVVAIIASLALLPRSTFGFCAGSAFVIGTFVVFNKQVFYNEWQLVAGLVVIAAAVCGLQSKRLDAGARSSALSGHPSDRMDGADRADGAENAPDRTRRK